MTKKQLNVLLKNVKDDEEIMFYVMDAEYKDDDSDDGLYDMGEAKFISLERSCYLDHITLTLHVRGN